jgi:hypothetical protein
MSGCFGEPRLKSPFTQGTLQEFARNYDIVKGRLSSADRERLSSSLLFLATDDLHHDEFRQDDYLLLSKVERLWMSRSLVRIDGKTAGEVMMMAESLSVARTGGPPKPFEIQLAQLRQFVVRDLDQHIDRTSLEIAKLDAAAKEGTVFLSKLALTGFQYGPPHDPIFRVGTERVFGFHVTNNSEIAIRKLGVVVQWNAESGARTGTGEFGLNEDFWEMLKPGEKRHVEIRLRSDGDYKWAPYVSNATYSLAATYAQDTQGRDWHARAHGMTNLREFLSTLQLRRHRLIAALEKGVAHLR